MFRHVSEFAIRTADLIEAESRLIRRQLPRLGMGLGLLIVASLMTVVGGTMLLVALWLGVERAVGEPYGPSIASLVTGVLALGMAAGAYFGASQLHK